MRHYVSKFDRIQRYCGAAIAFLQGDCDADVYEDLFLLSGLYERRAFSDTTGHHLQWFRISDPLLSRFAQVRSCLVIPSEKKNQNQHVQKTFILNLCLFHQCDNWQYRRGAQSLFAQHDIGSALCSSKASFARFHGLRNLLQ